MSKLILKQIPGQQDSTNQKNNFTTASQIHDSARPLRIPDHLQAFLGGFISTIDPGTVTLLEGDKSSIKTVHTMLHDLMIDAIIDDFQVQLIDVANCFDPQYLNTAAFENSHDPHEIMKQIKLARPFQMFQCANIIKDLAKRLKEANLSQKQLIIITSVSGQFFAKAMENEDTKFPVPQLEMFRYSLGIVQSLASMGYTVVMTDVIDGELGPVHKPRIFNGNKNGNKVIRLSANNLAQVAKIRLRLHDDGDCRKVSLINHPFLSPQNINIRKQNMAIANDVSQTSLSDFF